MRLEGSCRGGVRVGGGGTSRLVQRLCCKTHIKTTQSSVNKLKFNASPVARSRGISTKQASTFADYPAVKACCTAPSLNPNMNPQKNKASLKRPQFFLPGLLKVALLPGHWCAWNRRRVDPPEI